MIYFLDLFDGWKHQATGLFDNVRKYEKCFFEKIEKTLSDFGGNGRIFAPLKKAPLVP
jgi:hypothetical protein